MAGYSGTPLLKKIGIKDGDRVLLVKTPGNFVDILGELPTGCTMVANGEAPRSMLACCSRLQPAI